MIILDTNVLSEVTKPEPDPAVLHWLDQMDSAALFTTAVTVGELSSGIACMPVGRRRRGLAEALARLVTHEFEGKILSFDASAAVEFGPMMATRQRSGRRGSVIDVQIAAVAWIHEAAIATRNVRDFELLGLQVINPWPERP